MATRPKRNFLKQCVARWRLRLLRRKPRAVSDALTLPPSTRAGQSFSVLMFFLLGVALTWFVVANPFDLGFLPQRGAELSSANDPHSEPNGAVYQCPMHPEVVEDHAAECPICGMTLVEVKAAPTSGEREILYWYAPMDATYIRDEPGLSPMGMKLVPKYADASAGAQDGVVRIDPVQVQNIGVVSERAELMDIARYSRNVGILDFNADKITWINTKFEGWIEKVHVIYLGDRIKKGDPLFEIYGPALVTTQEEYLRALDYRESLQGSRRPETQAQAESLVRSSRERLEYWDITDAQIERLERSRQVERTVTINSPADGVVAEVMSEALEGMFVKPGMNLYKIADLSTLWVHADIYEQDMPWIRVGQPATVAFRNAAQEQIRGKVLFLYPEVSRVTRTMKICVEIPNPQRKLRPGMFADVTVQGPLVKQAVVVPRSAVLSSGERNIIFVDLGEGRFEPREVVLGVRSEDNHIQLLEGVAAGELVVTQSQFMLDSESRIQEAIAQFRDRGTAKDRP